MNSLENFSWEALPPRSSRQTANLAQSPSRKRKQDDSETIIADTENINADKFKQIRDNIESRAQIHRAETTLQSRDGCAGEFYECNFLL
jgi:hypothetical protein